MLLLLIMCLICYKFYFCCFKTSNEILTMKSLNKKYITVSYLILTLLTTLRYTKHTIIRLTFWIYNKNSF